MWDCQVATFPSFNVEESDVFEHAVEDDVDCEFDDEVKGDDHVEGDDQETAGGTGDATS